MLFLSFWTAAEEGITYGLEKTEGAMKIGETRWTGNIGYTRQKTKIYKTINTTQRTKLMSDMDSTKNRWKLTGAREWQTIPMIVCRQ
jgi:hypothetical protein